MLAKPADGPAARIFLSSEWRRRKPSSKPSTLTALVAAISAALALVACGGGGGSSGSATSGSANNVGTSGSVQTSQPIILAAEANAPALTNITATDGLNWFNFRRQQMGLSALTRNGIVDKAAQAHSDYQRLNNTITHDEIAGRPGFTGAELYNKLVDPDAVFTTAPDRLRAAGYRFTETEFAFGEVISATSSQSGFDAAEDLIAAIYHRFVIMEPKFREAGAGSATVSGGYTYFTTNFTANGLGAGLGTGGLRAYPYSGQINVPTVFYSDRESPDPVAGRNEVGYPISVHADIDGKIVVTSFTIAPRNGTALPTYLLTRTADIHTPESAAAIIPAAVLTAKTVYDVAFAGTVDGVSVTRSWSFTTQ